MGEPLSGHGHPLPLPPYLKIFRQYIIWRGTLLVPVKAISLPKTWFFLPCVPYSVTFLTI
jgi:hypothetical protein